MRVLCLLVVVSVVSAPAVARADAKACVSHHATGKELRKKGALIGAKEEFLKCAEDACPKLVREECRELVSKLASEIPSVVVVAKDATGRDLTSGRVLLDGKELEGALGGRGIPVDPGPHTLELVTGDGQRASVEFVARDGDKSRSVEVRLAALGEPPPSTAKAEAQPEPATRGATDARPSKTPVLAYALAGVAAAAFGSFAYFALDGKSKKSDLDACKPGCRQSDVDAMRRSFLIGDISLGIGVLALGGSTYFFLAKDSPEQRPGSARGPAFVGVRGRW